MGNRSDRAAAPEPLRAESAYQELLNGLPTCAGRQDWLEAFRDRLRSFLGDVDRVTINVNFRYGNPGVDVPQSDMIVTEYFTGRPGREPTVHVTPTRLEESPSERLITQLRKSGASIEQYQTPHTFDYFVEGDYVGSIILWRETHAPPIEQDTLGLLETLRPFIIFAMTDAIVRFAAAIPYNRAFHDALSSMRSASGLSEQESRVLILLLFGHTYQDIADQLDISLDTVRSHIQKIYRKTETHSTAQIFAKFFIRGGSA